MDITRKYVKRATAKSNWDGFVGEVRLRIEGNDWELNGVELAPASKMHLANFALQTLQDAYAGATNMTEAKAAFEKKLDKILNGTIGMRGVGEDAIMRFVRAIIRPKLTGANKAAYDALDTQRDRDEFLNDIFANLPEEKADAVMAAAERAQALDEKQKREAAEFSAANKVDVEI